MASKDYPPPGYRFVLDLEKLYAAFESKRKQDKLSRDRIAARYGLAKNSFIITRNKASLDAKVLIPIIKYLGKDIDEFIKTVEVNNGSTQRGNSRNSVEGETSRLDGRAE